MRLPLPGMFRALVLTGAILAVPHPAAAAETFDVTGVAADDVLNLRASPAARAAIVGALAPTTTGIAVERRSGNWAYVRYGNKAGWVDIRYLRANPSAVRDGMPVPLDCFGTEPFWSIALGAASLRFEALGQQAYSGPAPPVRTSANEMRVWLVRPEAGPVARVVVRAAPGCEDGMSDETYPYSVAAEMRDGQFYSGCCREGR